jgi:hypothetical protein
MRPISNLNSVLVKNYGPGSDTLAVLRELKKLGIIKSSKAKPKAKAKMIEDIKQNNDMVGYVKNLSGEPNRLSPNLFTLRQIEPGMSQQQIEDIQRTNAAQVAALQGELQQNRNETQATIGGLVGAASQRFSQINNVLGQLVNPKTERFRGQQEAGAGIYDPMANLNPNVILLGNEPDVQNVPMDQTLNEGGPGSSPNFATSTFPVEETGNISSAPPNLQPREKLGGGTAEINKTVQLNNAADKLGLPTIPKSTAKKPVIQKYYNDLIDKLQIQEFIGSGSKEDFLSEINGILEGYISE